MEDWAGAKRDRKLLGGMLGVAVEGNAGSALAVEALPDPKAGTALGRTTWVAMRSALATTCNNGCSALQSLDVLQRAFDTS